MMAEATEMPSCVFLFSVSQELELLLCVGLPWQKWKFPLLLIPP